jgi:hypothetical protein
VIVSLGQALEPNQMISGGLLIVGIVFICAWLLMRIRKRSLRGPGHPTAQEHLERYKQKDAVRDDLERLMVDIEQLAKRLGAQLDAKSLQLEKLIDDADLRVGQLQQALREQHGQPSSLPAEPSDDAQEARPAPAAGLAPAAPPADPLAADVYRLADAGHDPPAIARQLDEHVGKVELILALRNA